jgi:hypothetical protein
MPANASVLYSCSILGWEQNRKIGVKPQAAASSAWQR